MKTLDKLKGNFFNKKSFNVGFNNRSPLSYISSTGPSVPSFSDPGLQSFSPSDWEGAYDTSDAVRAETKAEIAKGEGVGGAVWSGVKKIAGAVGGGKLSDKGGAFSGDADGSGKGNKNTEMMKDIEGIFGGNKEQPKDKLQEYKDLKEELGL
jgi:hypothetical protein